jgi:hypothetical protein
MPRVKRNIASRLFHRKTFIRGRIHTKYFGEIDGEKFIQNGHEQYFDINFYDTEITIEALRANNEGPFPEFEKELLFKGEIKPMPLPALVRIENKEGHFNIHIHDIKLANFKIDPLLHQTEGEEVFGTLDADITGYLLEQRKEEQLISEEIEEEIVGSLAEPEDRFYEKKDIDIIASDTVTGKPSPVNRKRSIYRTGIKTGQTIVRNDYEWTQYWMSDFLNTYEKDPRYIAKGSKQGWSLLGNIFWILLLIGFLLLTGKAGLFLILGYFLVLLFFTFIEPIITLILRHFGWIAGLIGGIILISTLSSLWGHGRNDNPRRDKAEETTFVELVDSTASNQVQNDTIIRHRRIWKDQDGDSYDGVYSIKRSDLNRAMKFKTELNPSGSGFFAYDQLLFSLWQADKENLKGVFHMLDSIRTHAGLDTMKFAKMVVAFVQDIPYSLVLDNACNPRLYADRFIRNYLENNDGPCDPYQKFGINTPVEFLAGLKGDCDTRTLLLFSLLNEFDYKVAILSSEYYAHSMLGLRIPLEGESINYNDSEYLFWESTQAGVPAGIIPRETNNKKFWRVSLTN